jgi:helicase SWR1
MLKKANQKRMLDKVVIQEGEFTTDFFGKMDWRDVIDPVSTDANAPEPEGKVEDIEMADEPTAVDQETLKPRAGEERELARALAEVEDEEDAAAARIAQGEGELDFEEFDGENKKVVVPKRVGFDRLKEGSGTPVTPAPAVAVEGMADEEEGEEEEDDGIGSVDEYMLKLVEWDWNFFVTYRA